LPNERYKRICELHPERCDLFYTSSYDVHQMEVDPEDAPQSLYVNTSVCAPELASCAAANTSAFTFLKCPGLDATKVTLIETYDLPLVILAQV
jgi:hypothetical protein